MKSIARLLIGFMRSRLWIPSPFWERGHYQLLVVANFDVKGFQHAFDSFLRGLFQSIFGIDRTAFRSGRDPALSGLVNLLVSSAPLFDPGRVRFEKHVSNVQF